MTTIRTRFAPSPTGHLHIGGVRTAFFNWLFARRHGGQFILRIDDTDQQRHVETALQPILSGFRWLGLDWDEGPEVGGPHEPYFQSERSERYSHAVEQLLASGKAYRDFARPDELQLERQAAEKTGQSFRYSRRWMAETDRQAAAFEAEDRRSVVRLKIPESGACRFDDLVRGPMEIQWNQEQDHVIQRADGTCLYHLANVVDDHEFEISHVIRAVEHLSNTPRQIFIAESLGIDSPRFAHLPYVAEPGSESKLSKRKLTKYLKHQEFRKLYEHGCEIMHRMQQPIDEETFQPVLVEFYRRTGYVPHAILNYVLLLGWSLDDKTEFLAAEEMVQKFSLERVNKSPASFDPLKLWSFQQHYMNELPPLQKLELVQPYLIAAGWIADPPSDAHAQLVQRLIVAAGDRIKISGDILDYPEFFLDDSALPFDDKAVKKRMSDPSSRNLLSKFSEQLESLNDFNADTLETTLKQWIESEGIAIGKIIHALRIAVTGRPVGLGIFETLAMVGKEAVLRRIAGAIEYAQKLESAQVVDPSS